MDKKQTLEAIKVMQAFADGDEIECKKKRADVRWSVVDPPAWHWADYDYRVKPKPIEFEVWYNPNPPAHLRNIIGASENCASDDDYWKDKGYTKIKVREVQD